MLSKENKKNNVFESVKNVCSYSELKDLIKKLDENALRIRTRPSNQKRKRETELTL